MGWFGRYADVDGERLHYVEAGSGPPLLLIHGFMEWSFTWRRNLAALGSRARTLAPDLRGYGLTAKNPLLDHSQGAQAELLRAFMDTLQIPSAVLCGHSMGGEIAVRFALRYPDRVRALVLDAPSGYLTRPVRPWERLVLRLPGVGSLVVRSTVMNRRFAARVLRSVCHAPETVTPDDVEGYLLPATVPGAAGAFRRILCDLDFGSAAAQIPDVACPTLIIWGENDPVVPVAHGYRLAEELTGSRLLVLPNCGHLPHEEQPAQFNDAVLAFLAELATAPGEQEGSCPE